MTGGSVLDLYKRKNNQEKYRHKKSFFRHLISFVVSFSLALGPLPALPIDDPEVDVYVGALRRALIDDLGLVKEERSSKNSLFVKYKCLKFDIKA